MLEIDQLDRAELAALVRQLSEANGRLSEQVAALESEIDRLRSGGPGTGKGIPAFVKPNRPERSGKPRNKRAHGFARQRETPTKIVSHALETCPDCGRPLSGGTVKWKRQVIEIPLSPAEIVQHEYISRYCGVCRKRHAPRAEKLEGAVGKRRVSASLMSLVGYYHEVCRMPLATIQKTLKRLHGLDISCGELTGILHATAQLGKGAYAGLIARVRSSGHLHADETGWREDGANGYIWSFSTPDTRVFAFDRSRASRVPAQLLGDEFKGVLVSDGYCAYNYYAGEHQRCWAHLVRRLKELRQKHAEPEMLKWADRVTAICRAAREYACPNKKARARQRVYYQRALASACESVADKEAPHWTLAQHMLAMEDQLFAFVEHPDVPSDNNPAERAIRPLVIARKISGGTRSAKGSLTRSILQSLFSTWILRGCDPLELCRQTLAGEPAADCAAD